MKNYGALTGRFLKVAEYSPGNDAYFVLPVGQRNPVTLTNNPVDRKQFQYR